MLLLSNLRSFLRIMPTAWLQRSKHRWPEIHLRMMHEFRNKALLRCQLKTVLLMTKLRRDLSLIRVNLIRQKFLRTRWSMLVHLSRNLSSIREKPPTLQPMPTRVQASKKESMVPFTRIKISVANSHPWKLIHLKHQMRLSTQRKRRLKKIEMSWKGKDNINMIDNYNNF